MCKGSEPDCNGSLCSHISVFILTLISNKLVNFSTKNFPNPKIQNRIRTNSTPAIKPQAYAHPAGKKHALKYWGQSTFLPPVRSVNLVTKINNQNVEFMLPITLHQHDHVFVLVCFY